MQLIRTFYRHAILSSVEDSVRLAFDTTRSYILITGDFNLDIQKDNSTQNVKDLFQQFSLSRLYMNQHITQKTPLHSLALSLPPTGTLYQ